MFKPTVAALALLMVVGCQNGKDANSPTNPKGTSQAPTDTERAAYAASHKFPTTAPAQNNMAVAAIVNRDQGVIKVYNFSTTPIREVDVWVNDSFVVHSDGLPASGSVIVRYSTLYNAMGRDLTSQKEPIRKVTLVSGETVYNVWGPASE